MKEPTIKDAAVEGITNVSRFAAKLKLLAGGFVIAGIGVTQAIFGWVGTGFVYRFLYPIPLIVFGGLMVWSGFALQVEAGLPPEDPDTE